MTKKIVKWYKRVKTWKVVLGIITPIASGELLAFFADVVLPTWVHVAVGVAAILAFYLKMVVKDDNNNGIVDSFEDNE
jgi:hypothetical protein